MKLNVIRILLLSILTNQGLDCLGQNVRFTHLTVDQGLPSNSIYAICQDQSGYLWFGGRLLSKYNAYEFTPYSTSTYKADYVEEIFQSNDSSLWLATNKGPVLYNRKNDEFILFDSGYVSAEKTKLGSCRNLSQDSKGTTYALTNAGLFFYKPGNQTFSCLYRNNEGIEPTSFLIDKEDNFWIGTGDGQLFMIPPGSNKLNKIPIGERRRIISDLVSDADGSIWIGTNSGLLNYKVGSIREYSKNNSKLIDDYINDLHIESSGRLWIGTDAGGVSIFNRRENSFTNFQHEKSDPASLSGNAILKIYSDHAGLVWVSTLGGGLNIYNPSDKNILHFKEENSPGHSLSNNHVTSFFETPSGSIYIGTDKGGINEFNPNTQSFKRITPYQNTESGASNILGLSGDPYGKLWVATWGEGVLSYDLNNKQVNHYRHHSTTKSIAGNNVWTVLCAGDTIFLGIHSNPGQGLDIIDQKTGNVTHYNTSSFTGQRTISDDGINKFFMDDKKRLWIGLNGAGVNMLDTHNKLFSHYDLNKGTGKGLANGFIQDIMQDKSGRLWFATRGGLCLWKEKEQEFTYYNSNDGFPTDEIVSILQDSQGNLWLGSNKGIIKFNPDTRLLRHYTKEDGLQSNEFSAGAALKTIKGYMYFGGVNGFNVFHPDSLVENQYVPPVVITKFSIFNDPYCPKTTDDSLSCGGIDQLREIVLEYDQSFFTIEFAGISTITAEKNQYAYILEGLEEHWNNVGNRRSATYTNVPPGKYTFRVKASNNDGLWNKEGASLSIVITPPFWNTTLFQVTLFIVVMAGSISLYKVRINSIKKRQVALEKLVISRTEEVMAQKNEIQLQRDKILENNRLLEEINENVISQAAELKQTNQALVDNFAELEMKNEILEIQKKEISEQKNKIEDISQRMHDVDQQKIKFFTNISHELKTPLTLISGPCKKLASDPQIKSDARLVQWVDLIDKNGNRLMGLINELLELRKIDEGQMRLTLAEYDIIQFIRNILDLYEELANQRNIELQLVTGLNSIRFYFDAEKVDKIIQNLLSNAFKFSPEGSTISVEIGQDNDENAQIKVCDQGKGIEPDLLEKIFDRYYSTNTGGMGMQSDSGIGLSLAKELADLHRGSLSVSSQVNNGSTFLLSLPLRKEMYKDDEFDRSSKHYDIKNNHAMSLLPNQEKNLYPEETITDTSKPVIVIIEDNVDIRLFLKSELIEEYTVFEAEDGAKGVEVALRFVPDLIISDVMMPNLDGINVVRQLKINPITDHIPVILLTALASGQAQLDGFMGGADDYVTKPLDIDILKLKIGNVLNTRAKFRQKLLQVGISNNSQQTPEEIFLQKVFSFLDAKLEDAEFQGDQLADELCMSKIQLYRKLKTITGHSINNFIRSYRLKKGLSLLKQKHLSISEVAYQIGFKTPRYFSQSFKEEFGISPTEYMSSMPADN